MHIHCTQDQIAADCQRYLDFQREGMEVKTLLQLSLRPALEVGETRLIEKVSGGWYTMLYLKMGEVLRLVFGGVVSVLLAVWVLPDMTERLCLPDMVKLQWTTDLTKGRVIFLDMGCVMLFLVEDSSGAHDVLTGGSSLEIVVDYSGDVRRNTRDNMLLAAAKLGLDWRDIPAVLNLFALVCVDVEGCFIWYPVMLAAGDWVDLRAEMDLCIVLLNCCYLLDSVVAEVPPDLLVMCLFA